VCSFIVRQLGLSGCLGNVEESDFFHICFWG
jgi:hypothetical protein